jgi:HSP20 family protein
VTLDAPGARKEDIEVSIDGRRVTVQAEVRREEKTEGKDLLVERYSGRTYRSFTLPQEIDREKCQANYENGVLTLTLPRKGDGEAKRLTVN